MPYWVAFKWLVRERDNYKNQLEQIQDEIKKLRIENNALIHDYKSSEWFKQKEDRIRQLEMENRELCRILGAYYNYDYETD